MEPMIVRDVCCSSPHSGERGGENDTSSFFVLLATERRTHMSQDFVGVDSRDPQADWHFCEKHHLPHDERGVCERCDYEAWVAAMELCDLDATANDIPF